MPQETNSDATADAQVGKRHWVVRLGRKHAAPVYGILLALAYVTLVAGVVFWLARAGVRVILCEKGRVGGEQSGHIVMTDYATTGDGLIAALQFLAAMVETGEKASELARVFEPVPQKLINLRFKAGTAPLEADAVQQAIADGEAALEGVGRLLIRKSGTEPLIRVMGEAEDLTLLDQVLERITQAVRDAS